MSAYLTPRQRNTPGAGSKLPHSSAPFYTAANLAITSASLAEAGLREVPAQLVDETFTLIVFNWSNTNVTISLGQQSDPNTAFQFTVQSGTGVAFNGIPGALLQRILAAGSGASLFMAYWQDQVVSLLEDILDQLIELNAALASVIRQGAVLVS